MFATVGRVLPVARTLVHKCVPRRNFWDIPQLPSLRAALREMNNDVARMERAFFNNTPLLTQISPRMVPIHAGDNEFRLNVDVQGYNPDEVSVNVSENLLTITGKMERTGDDGSKYNQEFSRQMTLPENIVAKALKSYLNPSGMLVIEAPLDVKVNEIPVKHLGTGEKEIESK